MDKTYIISIEGLDGVGKSTFAELLVNRMELLANKECKNINIIYKHFPNYDSESGKQIKDFLNESPEYINEHRDKLMDLFIHNRYDWYKNEYCNLDKDAYNFIVVDRYELSNYIYNIPFYDKGEMYNKMMEKHDKEMKLTNYQIVPAVTVWMHCSSTLQLQRLSKRQKTDSFELFDNQMFLRDNIKDILRTYYLTMCSGRKIIIIPILSHIMDAGWVCANHPYLDHETLMDLTKSAKNYYLKKILIELIQWRDIPKDVFMIDANSLSWKSKSTFTDQLLTAFGAELDCDHNVNAEVFMHHVDIFDEGDCDKNVRENLNFVRIAR